jgi:hypothetical protein
MAMKTYFLIGTDGKRYESMTPGTLGGHKRNKGYGQLDCPAALLWIAKGYYVKHRVFFADEPTAIAAGYRPCATCMKEHYAVWKKAQATTHNRKDALTRYRTLLDLSAE